MPELRTTNLNFRRIPRTPGVVFSVENLRKTQRHSRQRRLEVIKRHSDISVVSPDGTVIVFVTARGGAAHLP
jgi:hypothetical protein